MHGPLILRREWLLLLPALLLAALPAHADFAGAADRIRDSVVTVAVEKRMGTGFVVNGEGYVLTNKHVLDSATQATVKLANGDELPAKLHKADDQRDLAILKVERANLPAVVFASSSRLKQGSEVAALGAPLGLPDTLTKGIISSPSREISGHTYIQIDAALNQGNSGGPIINEQGQVVGVATKAALKAENMGFAIPSDDAMAFLGESTVTFATLDAPAATEGEVAAPPVPEKAVPEGPPAAGPEAAPPAEPAAPATGFMQPWMWLVAAALIAFLVSLVTSLLVAKTVAARAMPATPMGQPELGYPAPGWGESAARPTPAAPPPPAAPPTEDLSDIDIELR